MSQSARNELPLCARKSPHEFMPRGSQILKES